MSKLVAIFPGVFDPPTVGHTEIIRRLAHLFDRVHVVIAINSQKKSSLFSPQERVSLLKELTESWPHVYVDYHEGLIVDLARAQGASVIVRGIRSPDDVAYEAKIAEANKNLGFDTLFLLSEGKYQNICSSGVKREASLGRDISQQVPQKIYRRVKNRLCKQTV